MNMIHGILIVFLVILQLVSSKDSSPCIQNKDLTIEVTCSNIDSLKTELVKLENQPEVTISIVRLTSVTGDIPSDFLKNFPDATKLEIFESHISNFALQSENIRSLNVTSSIFPKVSKKLWKGCPNLTNIHLVSNEGLQFEKDAFLNLNGLIQLSIINQTLPRIQRRRLDNLENLALIADGLAKIDDDAFQDLPNLRELFLDSNPIESLPSSIGSLTNLFRLSLFNTNIKKLDFDLLKPMKALRLIGLPKEALKNLNVTEMVEKVPSIKVVGGLSSDQGCSEIDSIETLEVLDKNEITLRKVKTDELLHLKDFFHPDC